MIPRWWWLGLLLLLLPAPVTSQADSTTVQVVRVIDGDTIRVCCVFRDRVTIRYIGIDTPETHHPMRGVEPYGMEAALEKAGITVNKNAIPFDPEKPAVTSGIRIGTPVMTTRGMREEEMRLIGQLIAEVLQDVPDEGRQRRVRRKVRELCQQFPS